MAQPPHRPPLDPPHRAVFKPDRVPIRHGPESPTVFSVANKDFAQCQHRPNLDTRAPTQSVGPGPGSGEPVRVPGGVWPRGFRPFREVCPVKRGWKVLWKSWTRASSPIRWRNSTQTPALVPRIIQSHFKLSRPLRWIFSSVTDSGQGRVRPLRHGQRTARPAILWCAIRSVVLWKMVDVARELSRRQHVIARPSYPKGHHGLSRQAFRVHELASAGDAAGAQPRFLNGRLAPLAVPARGSARVRVSDRTALGLIQAARVRIHCCA